MSGCKRCEDWSRMGLSNTCPSCDMADADANYYASRRRARRLAQPPNYVRSIVARTIRAGRHFDRSDEQIAVEVRKALRDEGFKIVEIEK